MALFPPLLVGNPQEFAPEAAVEAGGLSHQGPDMEVVQQRGLYGPWQCQVCREAAPGTRDMVLLGLFLAFSISAPMRTNCGGGVVAWIAGILEVPVMQGSWCQVHREAGSHRHKRNGAFRVFPSLWQLCPSEDQLWRRCCCSDRGDPDGAGYAGNPAATGTGGMMLLGFFLASGSSAPARTNCGGGVVAWIVGTVTTPTAQGSWWPRAQKIWHCQNLFLVSDGWHPWLVLWSFSVDQCIRCSNPTPSGCVSSLLFSTQGTQKAIISGVFSIKCQHWCVGRESSECSPHCVRLSSSTLPPWLPRFPPEAFFTTNSKERDNN